MSLLFKVNRRRFPSPALGMHQYNQRIRTLRSCTQTITSLAAKPRNFARLFEARDYPASPMFISTANQDYLPIPADIAGSGHLTRQKKSLREGYAHREKTKSKCRFTLNKPKIHIFVIGITKKLT
ncbi:hypothetical protein [Brenneria goodwinii]|nr:hypothetical protein [Brenneria goodwinii]